MKDSIKGTPIYTDGSDYVDYAGTKDNIETKYDNEPYYTKFYIGLMLFFIISSLIFWIFFSMF